MAFPKTRMRRLRASAGLRGLVRETRAERRAGSCCRCSSPRPASRRASRSPRCPASSACPSSAAVAEAREAAALGIGAVMLFGSARREGRARLGGVGRGGRRAAGDARDQAGAARAARDHRRVPVRVHEPRALRRAARRRGGGQRRDDRAARAHGRQPRARRAPTSWHPRT